MYFQSFERKSNLPPLIPIFTLQKFILCNGKLVWSFILELETRNSTTDFPKNTAIGTGNPKEAKEKQQSK